MHTWVLEGVGEDFGVFVQVIVLLLVAGVFGFQCQVVAVGVSYVGRQVLLPEGGELPTAGGSLQCLWR